MLIMVSPSAAFIILVKCNLKGMDYRPGSILLLNLFNYHVVFCEKTGKLHVIVKNLSLPSFETF